MKDIAIVVWRGTAAETTIRDLDFHFKNPTREGCFKKKEDNEDFNLAQKGRSHGKDTPVADFIKYIYTNYYPN